MTSESTTTIRPLTHPTTAAFTISALPAHALDAARGADESLGGAPVERVVATGNGEPLRCCLRDARPGEELILFGYEPPLPASPYREVGPVFAHASSCGAVLTTDAYPSGWIGRPQVLRAYDSRGWIVDSRVHDGSDPEQAIAKMLADPAVVQIHSRNVAYGCFMFTITRPV